MTGHLKEYTHMKSADIKSKDSVKPKVSVKTTDTKPKAKKPAKKVIPKQWQPDAEF